MSNLRQGKFSPVYVLHGPESYYIDCVSDYIAEHVLDPMAREFDQTIVYGRDLQGADIASVISAARGFAMMGGKKVVIVREAQTIKKWDALAQYLDNPQPDTILVICHKYNKLDARLSLWKAADKKGVVMLSERLRDYEVEGWVRTYIQRRMQELGLNLSIDPKVPRLLADSIGTDLCAIVAAVQKVVDGRPDGTTVIDAGLVERNVGISKDFNVYELQNALIQGDVVKANRITRYFASSKDHPIVKELPQVYTLFANLMIYHYLPDRSNQQAVASALGINPYFVRDYVAAAKRFSAGKTFAIIGYIRDIDARSKGVNNPSAKDADLWKELIYKILH